MFVYSCNFFFRDTVPMEDTIFNREIEQSFIAFSEEIFTAKTAKSLFLAKKVGNMYTPSLYGCLVSVLIR